MNNYIILENRPELTTAQVLGGMNFSAIVAGAASASKDAFDSNSFGLRFMSKGFLAVLIVVGGVAIYKNYTTYKDGSPSPYTELNSDENILIRKSGKGPDLVIETIPPKNPKYLVEGPNAACQPAGSDHTTNDIQNHMTTPSGPHLPLENIDSLIAVEDAMRAAGTMTKGPVLPAQMVQMPQQQIACRKEGDNVGNGMTEETKTFNTAPPFNNAMPVFKPSPNAKSYLWQPISFNKNVDAATGQFKLDCNGCDFSYISGTQLDGKNYKGVWMRVTKDKKIKFKLETGLKNITLTRTVGDKQITMHPVAVGIDGPQWRQKEWTYISNQFKTEGATYTFGNHIDFYIIFEDAKAGDKLVIDDFVETLVMEK